MNSVLDGIVNYYMQALPLPPGAITWIDNRRRAFLWSGTDKTSGAKCLVNWDTALLSKQEGGLGARDLATQNACLLLKLIHRLYNPQQSAWAAWASQHNDIVSMEGNRDGHHWQCLQALAPAYRAITTVSLGNGVTTSFWWDTWHDQSTMAIRFPCLLTHCLDSSASVRQVLQTGIDNFLVTRLSPHAIAERQSLCQIINSVQPTDQPDVRKSRFLSPQGTLVNQAGSTPLSGRAKLHTGLDSLVGYYFRTGYTAGPTCTTRISWTPRSANYAPPPRKLLTTYSSSAQSPLSSGQGWGSNKMRPS